jgi:hypothetical protein
MAVSDVGSVCGSADVSAGGCGFDTYYKSCLAGFTSSFFIPHTTTQPHHVSTYCLGWLVVIGWPAAIDIDCSRGLEDVFAKSAGGMDGSVDGLRYVVLDTHLIKTLLIKMVGDVDGGARHTYWLTACARNTPNRV